MSPSASVAVILPVLVWVVPLSVPVVGAVVRVSAGAVLVIVGVTLIVAIVTDFPLASVALMVNVSVRPVWLGAAVRV